MLDLGSVAHEVATLSALLKVLSDPERMQKLLVDVSAQVSVATEMYANTKTALADLEAREKAVQDKTDAAALDAQGISQARGKLKDREAALRQDSDHLLARLKQLEEDKISLSISHDAATKQKRELDALSVSLNQRERTLAANETELQRRFAEFESKQRRLSKFLETGD